MEFVSHPRKIVHFISNFDALQSLLKIWGLIQQFRFRSRVFGGKKFAPEPLSIGIKGKMEWLKTIK